MPIVNRKQQISGKNSTGTPVVSSFSKSGCKAPGMRLGTLEDWRQASGKSERSSVHHGHAVRDGR